METTNHATPTAIEQLPKPLFGGFWLRTIAFFVDQLMISSLNQGVYALLSFLTLTKPLTAGLSFVLTSLVAVGYFTLFTYLTNGFTVGKALVGVRTIQTDGQRLTLWTALVREGFGKLILMRVPLLGLVVLFTKQRENFMDLFCDTRVVSVREWQMLQTLDDTLLETVREQGDA